MRAIEAGLRILIASGVKYVFGIPAGSINALYDSLMDLPELKPIVAKHETGAGYMAAAYTRITGIPSLCVASSGPGATNLVTAAAHAWKEKLPVIFITGSVPLSKMGKGGAQELNGEVLFTSITKYNKTVIDAKELPAAIAEAYEIANSGVPGPVHLAIPIDIQMTEIDFDFEFQNIQKIAHPDPLDLVQLSEVTELLQSTGSRGTLLLGYGAKSAKAGIRAFAERTGWKVATTPRGKGAFPEDHPLSLGVYGLSGNEQAISYLNGREYDLLFVIGSSLGELATCNWSHALVQGKKIVHLDYDVQVLGQNYITDLTVCGAIPQVMEYLLSTIPTKEAQTPINSLFPTKSKPLVEDTADWNTLNAISRISEFAPDHTRFYIDIGEFMTYSIQSIRIKEQQDFDIDINFGAMGSGIGGAIGAQLAEPHRQIICVTGDGCFFMHGLEILTAKQYGLPVIFFVINNARLGMVHHGHLLQYKRCLADFSQTRVDIAAVAGALGIHYSQVNSAKELQHLDMDYWFSRNETTIIEIVVDGDEVPPMGERVKFLQGATN
ncbi:thiamine pyrophosphate-binding protein [Paenibacillus psychroresistens]|nr:thiamine pyrophosphate-binding protein [Paenibacillus psychroresistens]